MHRHRVVGVAGHDPDRRTHRPPAVAQLDQILVRQAHALGGGWADQRRVVPGDRRDRLGQFLEPAVVGEAAIPDRQVGAEDDL